MIETFENQLARVRKQAELSGNTQWGAAQRAVLDRIDTLQAAMAEKQEGVCSYCGAVTPRDGRTMEELNAAIRSHILGCDKRPEVKLLNTIMAITVPLGIHPGSFDAGDIDSLVAAIDKRWNEVLAMIPVEKPPAICTYCDRETEEGCDKRPDVKVLRVTLPLNSGSFEPGDMASLTAAIDARWKEVLEAVTPGRNAVQENIELRELITKHLYACRLNGPCAGLRRCVTEECAELAAAVEGKGIANG
jgi:hypothetical protein